MSKTTLQLAITVLTLITAAIHLYLAPQLNEPDVKNLQIPFFLNGIGYLALLYALLRPPAFLQGRASLVHYAFIAFASVTILGYFAVNGFNPDDNLGLIDKAAEILLVAALFLHLGKK